MKSLLVTGASGFVGGWFRRLGKTILDQHGLDLRAPPDDFDLLDARQVDDQLRRHRPDAVIHLAGQSNVALSFQDPEATLRVNLLGTLKLLEGLKRAGLAPTFLFVSSGDVYGLVEEGAPPITEDRPPRPRNPYAVSKAAAEMLCMQWATSEGLPVMVARPFNHVGAGQSDAFVLPSLARQVAAIRAGRQAASIRVGDIDVSRDFLHVSDVVSAYLAILCRGVAGETYNVASGSSAFVRDLLTRLLELSGVSAQVQRDPSRYRPAEQRTVKASNDKLSALGWRPRRSLDEALSEVLEEWTRKVANA